VKAPSKRNISEKVVKTGRKKMEKYNKQEGHEFEG